ncbi:MAG: hypothetical protein GW858_04115 [Sphingomonadales bacterium]|nr:hypothetical protein [Sphingomonadales bacterium]NCQ22083.1 hypothetical protein [Sphingomonadales bacterium]NCT03188.1 hypothetical protein [Sphingomonadales bacterium]
MTRKLVLACVACMGAALLAVYPLSLIGWEGAAGVVFIAAMLIAWIVAAAGTIRKFWRG